MKNVLLDCGSHLGESVKKFKYQLGRVDYDYYMFEPNTFLFEQIEANPEFDSCKKFNVAVSNRDEVVKFWGCTKNKSSVGSTLEKSKADWDGITQDDYIEIQAIDLSKFIQDSFSKDDHIVLKLDVEGAEYDVLDKLFETGVIGYIDELYCEFHTQWLSSEFVQREADLRKKLQEIGLTINYWDAL